MKQTTKPLSEMTLEELWQLFPIVLSDHDPGWENRYAEEKALLTGEFGNMRNPPQNRKDAVAI